MFLHFVIFFNQRMYGWFLKRFILLSNISTKKLCQTNRIKLVVIFTQKIEEKFGIFHAEFFAAHHNQVFIKLNKEHRKY